MLKYGEILNLTPDSRWQRQNRRTRKQAHDQP
jgi:hypothetical protein